MIGVKDRAKSGPNENKTVRCGVTNGRGVNLIEEQIQDVQTKSRA